MRNYNYFESMKSDIRDYIDEHYNQEEIAEMLENDRDDFESSLHDELWICDSVTGNASGSYTFNRYRAREYVLENIDLVNETAEEFCIGYEEIGRHFINEDWEWFDVSIRCYLLSSALSEVLDEMEA